MVTGKAHINIRGKDLYFTIKEVTISNNDILGFKDKYNKEYIFNHKHIVEVEFD